MTAPVRPAERADVSRIAASGAPVNMTLPTALGEHRWYGSTRFAGPGMARQFFLAPAGEHRVIASHIMPGARESRRTLRGCDAVLFEAPDRSDAALVMAGPYNEATTWFAGPAPAPDGLARLVNTFTFADSPAGASLTPISDLLVQQPGVTMIGRSDRSVLMLRRATEALPTLPDWAGMRLASGELWRGPRLLDPAQAGLVAGTPHQWRYLLAGDSAVLDLVLLGPESGLPASSLDEQQIVDALSALGAHWGG